MNNILVIEIVNIYVKIFHPHLRDDHQQNKELKSKNQDEHHITAPSTQMKQHFNFDFVFNNKIMHLS